MKLVYSDDEKYTMSPVLEMARLSGGGHVMDAWEDKAPTFPGSSSVGGGSSGVCSNSKHPRQATPWGRRGSSLGWWRDGTLTLSAAPRAPTANRTHVCASAQRWPKPASHRPNVATLGNTPSQTCALCWRKTLCAGGALEVLRCHQLS